MALLLGLLAKTSELLLRPFGFRKFINLSFSSIFGYLVHMSVDSSETIVSEMSMLCEDFKDVLLPLPPEEDDGMLIGSVVNGDLYMLRAAHTVLFSSPPCRRPTVSLENVMPQCPKTAGKVGF